MNKRLTTKRALKTFYKKVIEAQKRMAHSLCSSLTIMDRMDYIDLIVWGEDVPAHSYTIASYKTPEDNEAIVKRLNDFIDKHFKI